MRISSSFPLNATISVSIYCKLWDIFLAKWQCRKLLKWTFWCKSVVVCSIISFFVMWPPYETWSATFLGWVKRQEVFLIMSDVWANSEMLNDYLLSNSENVFILCNTCLEWCGKDLPCPLQIETQWFATWYEVEN